MAGSEVGVWQGGVAVHLPQPVHDPSSPLQPCKAPCKGHWLVSSTTTATLHAHFNAAQQTFQLELKLPIKADGSSSQGQRLAFTVDLFHSTCEAKLLLPAASNGGAAAGCAVLLLAHHANSQTFSTVRYGVCQSAQVVAFRFSSVLDAQALQRMLDSAQAVEPQQVVVPIAAEPAGAPVVAAPDQPAYMAPAPAGHASQGSGPPAVIASQGSGLAAPDADQSGEELELQGLLESYITEPGFMEYVDRLERVWERMERAADQCMG